MTRMRRKSPSTKNDDELSKMIDANRDTTICSKYPSITNNQFIATSITSHPTLITNRKRGKMNSCSTKNVLFLSTYLIIFSLVTCSVIVNMIQISSYTRNNDDGDDIEQVENNTPSIYDIHDTRRTKYKRLVFYQESLEQSSSKQSIISASKNASSKSQDFTASKGHFMIDPMLAVTRGEESPPQQLRQPYIQGDCVPMEEWQVASFPTCNIVHELPLSTLGYKQRYNFRAKRQSPFSDVVLLSKEEVVRWNDTKLKIATMEYEDNELFLLGRGWFRHTWKVSLHGVIPEVVVLKTLRFERDFFDEYFDLHRRDAVAMERLTSSPYIINIHAFCGQTAINEFADFIDGYQDFKNFAKKLMNQNDETVLKLKLQIATMLAVGLTHIHEIDGENNATLVHYDINPMNVAVTKGGIPKLNDFNVAEFMRWDVKRQERCGFYGRLSEPWWRAPEEMIVRNTTEVTTHHTDSLVPTLDEKVDVYALGNILYNLLTGHSPRGPTTNERKEILRDVVKRGIPPKLDDFYRTSKNPLIVAIVNAIDQCYEKNPKLRSSARDVATGLLDVLSEFKNSRQARRETSDIRT